MVVRLWRAPLSASVGGALSSGLGYWAVRYPQAVNVLSVLNCSYCSLFRANDSRTFRHLVGLRGRKSADSGEEICRAGEEICQTGGGHLPNRGRKSANH